MHLPEIKLLFSKLICFFAGIQFVFAQTNIADNNNPLLQKSPLQYQAPVFNLIKDEHFKPAFEYALKIHDGEIDAIANNTAKPTFENTVLALEISGKDLTRATDIFYRLTEANTNPELQKIEEEFAPIFSAHRNKLYLNSKIYNLIKAINSSLLKGEDKRLVEYYLQQFELAGANLSDADKEKIKKINEELATLSTNFNNRLLIARKKGALLITDVKELDGLSDEENAAAKQRAKDAGSDGYYLLGLLNTTQQPLLQNLKNRSVRERLFKSSWNRAEKSDSGDTRNILEAMAKLRLEKAQLMGKNNFAEWKLQDQMAKEPTAAFNLLAGIAKYSVVKAKKEAKEIQDLIDGQRGGFKLEPWDWNYYSEQVRKAKYDLDQSQIKPYFEVTTVLEKGVFFAAKRMYGITFKVRKDLPVYHPDVVAYEVFDKDGKSMSIY